VKELRNVSEKGPNERNCPKISIVTPSYNQARFLEMTMLSVLNQAYPSLEYVVIDGGSTDNSVEIIRQYKNHLAYWISEPDLGQYDALNKGFARTNGEIMGWINSDDKYTTWAFQVVSEIFSTLPEVQWITTQYPLTWDEYGRAMRCRYQDGYSYKGFFRGENLPGRSTLSTGWIQQESTFWRRSLWERAGGYIDSSLSFAGDFELWARFYQHSELYGVNTPLGGFRRYGDQKSGNFLKEYIKEAENILSKYDKSYRSRIFTYFIERVARIVPYRFRQMAIKHQLILPYKICVYDWANQRWMILII